MLAHGLRRAGARHRLPAAPMIADWAPPGRRLAARPHGGDVVRSTHDCSSSTQVRHTSVAVRHVPAVPDAAVGGAGRAAYLPFAALSPSCGRRSPSPSPASPSFLVPDLVGEGVSSRSPAWLGGAGGVRLRHLHRLGEGVGRRSSHRPRSRWPRPPATCCSCCRWRFWQFGQHRLHLDRTALGSAPRSHGRVIAPAIPYTLWIRRHAARARGST